MKVRNILLILLLSNLLTSATFAKAYIKKPGSNSDSATTFSKVVAIIEGIKAKVSIVKTESGYSIIIIQRNNGGN